MNSTHQKVMTVLYLVSALSGMGFFGLLIYFYVLYLQCSGTACWELLIGPAIASLSGTPFCVFAALCVSVKGDKVNKYVRWLTYLGFVFMGGNLLFYVVY